MLLRGLFLAWPTGSLQWRSDHPPATALQDRELRLRRLSCSRDRVAHSPQDCWQHLPKRPARQPDSHTAVLEGDSGFGRANSMRQPLPRHRLGRARRVALPSRWRGLRHLRTPLNAGPEAPAGDLRVPQLDRRAAQVHVRNLEHAVRTLPRGVAARSRREWVFPRARVGLSLVPQSQQYPRLRHAFLGAVRRSS